MTYEDFRIKALKAATKKQFKITNSYGIKDIYRYMKKHKVFNTIGYDLSEKDFRIIINAINLTLQEQLLQGKDIIFPQRLGKLEIRKRDTYVGLEGNKIKNTKPIDWDSTLKLWHEDKEAFINKTKIRYDVKECFSIRYNKAKAVFTNKIFFTFDVARPIKLKLKNIIKDRGFDAFYMEYGLR